MAKKAEKKEVKLLTEGQPQNSSLAGKKKQRWWQTISIFFLGFLLVLAIANYAMPRFLLFLGHAAKRQHYSASNSYLFAAPIMARADGQQKIQVNVFLLDKSGYGVARKPVELKITPNSAGLAGLPQVKALRSLTDERGQAVFEVVSKFAGSFKISANVNGQLVGQPVLVNFVAGAD